MTERKQVILHKCNICGKEFELSNTQKYSKIKKGKTEFLCSKECKAKYITNKIKKDRPTLKCCVCGKEFELSSDQMTRYNKGKTEFYCSQSCIMKYSYTKINIEERTQKLREHFKDIEWVEKRNNKIKSTCLEKYNVDNPFKHPDIVNRIKETKLVKYGNKNYNNRDKMRQTMLEHGFDIHAPRPKVGEKVSMSWKNKTDEQKTEIKKKLSISNTRVHNNMTLYRKLEISAIESKSQSIRWSKTTDEEKRKIFEKVLSHPNNIIRVISKTNKRIAEILDINTFEKGLGKYSYDLFKEPNILVEVDPTYTHNCSTNTWYNSTHKSKEYHRDKTIFAEDNGYRCLHIFDWDDIFKIKNLLQDKTTIYARKLRLQEVSINDTNEFLNLYHLQNTCRGQIIRIGLYLDNKLIQLMTFGKPRYNENYEWELLRLCTHKDYKVVGGAEKLFKHFLNTNNPSTVISYCDYSKFNGDVYSKLGFTRTGIATPSKHWSKGSKHITDNLLRQRGFDQLFGTNYGKGISNNELMLQNKWLPVYDCGQLTFIWKNIKQIL